MTARYKLIACKVMEKETMHVLNQLDAVDDFAIDWVKMDLHDTPEKLNLELRKIIANLDRQYEAIILLFGLCSNSTLNLAAPAGTPLVIPRVHDCISIFLGSPWRYQEEHRKEAGTYWFARGFLHREDKMTDGIYAGHSVGESMYNGVSREELYKQYVEEYGEENADYLIETLVDAWKKNYRRAVLLTWNENDRQESDKQLVSQMATENNWRYEEIPVNLGLLGRLLSGKWDANEFLIVPPGEKISASHNEQVITATAC